MKLLRVSVPNFRNLKNVELTFEPSLRPAVFPIGSENGGGKSTLLQLIFVLLSCSLDDDKIHFLENFLSSFRFLDNIVNLNDELKEYVLADLELIYNNTKINFHFTLHIKNQELVEDSAKDIDNLPEIAINIKNHTNKTKMLNLKFSRKEQLEREINILEKGENLYFSGSKEEQEERRIKEIKNNKENLEGVIKEINILSKEIKKIRENLNRYEYDDEDLNHILLSQKILSLKSVDLADLKNHNAAFYCQTNIEDYDLAIEALNFASKHIYLASPPNQALLFLKKETRKKLLTVLDMYLYDLRQPKKELPNFYIYNQLSIAEIIHAFKQARDQDFKIAINVNSNNLQYGTALKDLLEDFHSFLGNDKYIFPSDDMTSIIVRRKTSDNEFIELEPEDLSHGELKRLGLYAWIKYNNINDSIILIDEIENGLHPDWQYNIVNELASWGDNQYLLATHSFYLCEALTPSHVKIIEPKLLNPTSEQ